MHGLKKPPPINLKPGWLGFQKLKSMMSSPIKMEKCHRIVMHRAVLIGID
jgi:hypothetical protein